MNLESLRRKRVRRMGIKSNGHAGQRRMFFILDRATRKFHGDVGLWMQYLAFTRQQKASKKVSQVLTTVLRLHPTKGDLWIYAANYALEERGDMTEARSYMQRGLRFCKHSRHLWIEYAKLEMIYMAKIAARQKILGLDQQVSGKSSATKDESIDADMESPSTLTASGFDPGEQADDAVEDGALQKISATPALSGAIPIAIFDAAINQFEDDSSLGKEFFDMVAEFHGVPHVNKIQHHIVNVMCAKAPTSPAALICCIQEPTVDVEILSADFPRALSISLDRLKTTLQQVLPFPGSPETIKSRISLSDGVIDWILPILDIEEMDQDIRKVLIATLRKLLCQYRIAFQQIPRSDDTRLAELTTKLVHRGFEELAKPLVAISLRISSSDPRSLGPR